MLQLFLFNIPKSIGSIIVIIVFNLKMSLTILMDTGYKFAYIYLQISTLLITSILKLHFYYFQILLRQYTCKTILFQENI